MKLGIQDFPYLKLGIPYFFYLKIGILDFPYLKLGIQDFPYLKLGNEDLKAKSGQVSGLKVCLGAGMPKITLGIAGVPKILGRDYGIEERYRGR